jgi:hypothetical protein
VLESKGGKIYAKVNEWKPGDQGQQSRNADRPTPEPDASMTDSENIPF